MKYFLIALTLATVLTTPAFAASGDPRLIQGTIEWPATLGSEPVVIVRGEDGRVYSVDISGAVRHGSATLRGGERVALLALEAGKPHELTGLVIGSGDAATLARALSQGLTPVTSPAAAASVPPTTAASSSTPTPTAVWPASPAVTVPATAAAPPPPTTPPAATSAVAPAASASVAAPAAVTTPPAPPAAPQAPQPTAVTTPATPPAHSAPPPANGGTVPPPAVTPPVPGGTRVVTAPSIASKTGERRQWARVDGRVYSVEPGTLILRDSSGALVQVDISNLNPNVTKALRPGGPVSVYGYPLEQRFEAAGYIELDPIHAEPPRTRLSR